MLSQFFMLSNFFEKIFVDVGLEWFEGEGEGEQLWLIELMNCCEVVL
jgi:hypothetical protein